MMTTQPTPERRLAAIVAYCEKLKADFPDHDLSICNNIIKLATKEISGPKPEQGILSPSHEDGPLEDPETDRQHDLETVHWAVGTTLRAKRKVDAQIEKVSWIDGTIGTGAICKVIEAEQGPFGGPAYVLELTRRGEIIKASICAHDYHDPDLRKHFSVVQAAEG